MQLVKVKVFFLEQIHFVGDDDDDPIIINGGSYTRSQKITIIMCLASGLDCLHNDLDYKKWSNNRNIKSSNIWAKQNHHLTSLNHHQVALRGFTEAFVDLCWTVIHQGVGSS
ncbi:hypothetical protein HanPSC8_Chr17g0787171 [Helianthus annuus]|nr:hypothetical protein HanPSC8_Chr17g0787171 [Helianthus annuus]